MGELIDEDDGDDDTVDSHRFAKDNADQVFGSNTRSLQGGGVWACIQENTRKHMETYLYGGTQKRGTRQIDTLRNNEKLDWHRERDRFACNEKYIFIYPSCPNDGKADGESDADARERIRINGSNQIKADS